MYILYIYPLVEFDLFQSAHMETSLKVRDATNVKEIITVTTQSFHL